MKIIKSYLLSLASCNTLLNIGNLNEHGKQVYCGPCYRRQYGPQASVSAMKLKNRPEAYSSAVSRSLQTISSMSIDSSISSPRLNQTERNTSLASSPSRSSSENEFHDSIPSLRKRTYVTGVNLQHIHSRSSPMNSTVFKIIPLPSSICPRCAKTVYIAEEVKAAGKVIINFSLSSMQFYSSHFIVGVAPVLIVEPVSAGDVIQYTKVKFMITVSEWAFDRRMMILF